MTADGKVSCREGVGKYIKPSTSDKHVPLSVTF